MERNDKKRLDVFRNFYDTDLENPNKPQCLIK